MNRSHAREQIQNLLARVSGRAQPLDHTNQPVRERYRQVQAFARRNPFVARQPLELRGNREKRGQRECRRWSAGIWRNENRFERQRLTLHVSPFDQG